MFGNWWMWLIRKLDLNYDSAETFSPARLKRRRRVLQLIPERTKEVLSALIARPRIGRWRISFGFRWSFREQLIYVSSCFSAPLSFHNVQRNTDNFVLVCPTETIRTRVTTSSGSRDAQPGNEVMLINAHPPHPFRGAVAVEVANRRTDVTPCWSSCGAIFHTNFAALEFMRRYLLVSPGNIRDHNDVT